MILVTTKALKIIQLYFQKQQEEVSKINAFIEERISGNKIVSLYEMQDLNIKEFEKINESLTKNSAIANGFSNSMQPIDIFFSNLAFVILVAVGITLTSLGYIHTD
jgi:ATP-binding cassette subfamily B protein